MNRKTIVTALPINFKPNLSSFDTVCYLNSNAFSGRNLIAIGAHKKWVTQACNENSSFELLQEIAAQTNDWIFTVLSYDLKNEVEPLESKNQDYLELPDMAFFIPQVVLERTDSAWVMHYLEQYEETVAEVLVEVTKPLEEANAITVTDLKPVESKESYLEAIKQVKYHLQRGDIYQVNYCTGYKAKYNNPVGFSLYNTLNKLSQAPFSAYFTLDNFVLACGSPERFLKKEAQQLISQPIKGTAPIGSTDKENKVIMAQLKQNPKERAENIMIVDLVRNDLSRVAAKGSVSVTELCEPYSFKTVNQLISTVVCSIKEGVFLKDIMHATFPMGSMTGAPKIKAMQIAEEQEKVKRGWYSGAVGYLEPNGNFDFNVIIRSVIANNAKKCLLVQVGGGITISSEPENEYNECLLKAQSMLKCFYTQEKMPA
ncbi:MAG: anthranilate synthase component I family protein [Luteibaculaceae bacterium]